ncbi:hypothetical protein MUO79_01405 [Candidatus Bathyarchaeota archaeon]|nr:hypothetical protein [Candidatus Bathyarchaeota archaeon]
MTYENRYMMDYLGRKRPLILTGGRKIFPIPKIHAGLSFWGDAIIGNSTTFEWISNFIYSRENQYNDIHDFAILLQNELRTVVPELTEAEGTREYRYGKRGFHLAGFVKHEGQSVPTFYHIHNGQSETTPNINPRIINANHDKPPQKILEHFSRSEVPYVRNGDFFLYAELFDKLYSSFKKWSGELTIDGRPFVFPDSKKFVTALDAFSEFVRFWIRLVRDVYALSNLPEIIGGDISVLSISPSGETDFSVRP